MKSLCLSIAALAVTATSAYAVPLTGSGSNLAVASSIGPARQGRTVTPTGATTWDGSWIAPAAAPWVGTYSVVGPVPAGFGPLGISRYDFTSLPLGYLSSGTYFQFGDVDGGSTTTETFTLIAYDAGGAIINTPWLDEPIATLGSGTGGGGAILPGNTPGWSWNAGTGEYFIDGSTVTGGNPTITNILASNTNISFLSVERTSDFANFSLAAPLVPAPGAVALFGLAGAAGLRRRR